MDISLESLVARLASAPTEVILRDRLMDIIPQVVASQAWCLDLFAQIDFTDLASASYDFVGFPYELLSHYQELGGQLAIAWGLALMV